eukprot:CAMPEP_0177595624 /NCGR_PEP_ID=MMETSP0419_2-20121207/10483_1 /TAXON_ID=582737 /ORGANISM="Tetraselmis sp., Strain GSL018" /LENGTH=147 /DNA_ID=CAMNT_0019087151 /DNA_START=706 /DNA_END=1149 /DNA_ORIENTATION=-
MQSVVSKLPEATVTLVLVTERSPAPNMRSVVLSRCIITASNKIMLVNLVLPLVAEDARAVAHHRTAPEGLRAVSPEGQRRKLREEPLRDGRVPHGARSTPSPLGRELVQGEAVHVLKRRPEAGEDPQLPVPPRRQPRTAAPALPRGT